MVPDRTGICDCRFAPRLSVATLSAVLSLAFMGACPSVRKRGLQHASPAEEIAAPTGSRACVHEYYTFCSAASDDAASRARQKRIRRPADLHALHAQGLSTPQVRTQA